MLYQSELVWLAHQLDQQENPTGIPSMWKAIRETDFPDASTSIDKKRHVYLTGEPEVIYSMTDLFDSLPDEKKLHVFTKEQHTHPALDWMSITYYPAHELEKLPEGASITLFTTTKLPFWSRPYFLNGRISQVVSEQEILALHRFSNVRQTNIRQFSYNDLLDDTMIPLDKVSERPDHQLFPEVPKRFLLKFSQPQRNSSLSHELDEAAAEMLNTYWLQNHPSFPEWMPILLREIQQFLLLKENRGSRIHTLEQLKVWGLRDKRID